MTKIVIFVKSGCVEEVLASDAIEYLIVDKDTMDEEEARKLTTPDGQEFYAGVTKDAALPYTLDVEHYFSQV